MSSQIPLQLIMWEVLRPETIKKARKKVQAGAFISSRATSY